MHCRPVAIVETPSIGMQLRFTAINEKDITGTIVQLAEKMHWPRVVVLGHSFGSVMASWVAREAPGLVAGLGLLDPIGVLLFLPDVCHNFIYRVPK